MTRDDILDAAAKIFSQKGYHAASMQDIAEAVNLQKASLYHHVSSKQEMLVALLDRALDMLIERMQGVMVQPLPVQEKFRKAMQTYLLALLNHYDLAAVLLLEHRSLKPELRIRHIPRRDKFEYLWRELIQEGRSDGVFNSTDHALTARSLLGLMNWTIMWYSQDGQYSPEEIAEQLADLILNGMLVRTS